MNITFTFSNGRTLEASLSAAFEGQALAVFAPGASDAPAAAAQAVLEMIAQRVRDSAAAQAASAAAQAVDASLAGLAVSELSAG
jgi:hypothetical protein